MVIVIVAVKPSAVSDLPAGLRVERRVIEDDFAFVAGPEFLRALAVLDDGEDLAAVGAGLTITFKF